MALAAEVLGSAQSDPKVLSQVYEGPYMIKTCYNRVWLFPFM